MGELRRNERRSANTTWAVVESFSAGANAEMLVMGILGNVTDRLSGNGWMYPPVVQPIHCEPFA